MSKALVMFVYLTVTYCVAMAVARISVAAVDAIGSFFVWMKHRFSRKPDSIMA